MKPIFLSSSLRVRWSLWLAMLAVLLQVFAAMVNHRHTIAQLEGALLGQWLVCTPAGLVSLNPSERETAQLSAHDNAAFGNASAPSDHEFPPSANTGAGYCPFCAVAQIAVPLLAFGLLKFALLPDQGFTRTAAFASLFPRSPEQRHAPPQAPPVFFR
jgi:hypothetical protein